MGLGMQHTGKKEKRVWFDCSMYITIPSNFDYTVDPDILSNMDTEDTVLMAMPAGNNGYQKQQIIINAVSYTDECHEDLLDPKAFDDVAAMEELFPATPSWIRYSSSEFVCYSILPASNSDTMYRIVAFVMTEQKIYRVIIGNRKNISMEDFLQFVRKTLFSISVDEDYDWLGYWDENMIEDHDFSTLAEFHNLSDENGFRFKKHASEQSFRIEFDEDIYINIPDDLNYSNDPEDIGGGPGGGLLNNRVFVALENSEEADFLSPYSSDRYIIILNAGLTQYIYPNLRVSEAFEEMKDLEDMLPYEGKWVRCTETEFVCYSDYQKNFTNDDMYRIIAYVMTCNKKYSILINHVKDISYDEFLVFVRKILFSISVNYDYDTCGYNREEDIEDHDFYDLGLIHAMNSAYDFEEDDDDYDDD